MTIKKINSVFFSPNGTTAEVARTITDMFDEPCITLDLIRNPLKSEETITADNLAVVTMPVYIGRLPAPAVDMLRRLHGDHTAVIAAVVYGNRAYEDALLELVELLKEQGFTVISAGAFLAQHSIFQKIAQGRPDEKDLSFIQSFAGSSKNVLAKIMPDTNTRICVPGNRPYKKGGRVSLSPRAARSCNRCGICADLCPVGAISVKDPAVTDKELCIACGACISNCPRHARAFRGLLYKAAAGKFYRRYHERREPEAFYAQADVSGD